jgi:Rieske Fe-S protein
MSQDGHLRCALCGNPVEGPGEICKDCEERAKDPREWSRRKFLTAGTMAVGGILGVGYLATALKTLIPPPSTSAKLQFIGLAAMFPVDNYQLELYTGEGYPDGVYVRRRADGTFQAFDFHCAHLQCPVQWNQALQKFFCPCHGSVYNANGQHIAGPAPRGLYPHVIKVSQGRVYLGGLIT